MRQEWQLESLSKQLKLSSLKCANFESKYEILWRITEKNIKRTESLKFSLKSQEQTCLNLQSALKKSDDALVKKIKVKVDSIFPLSKDLKGVKEESLIVPKEIVDTHQLADEALSTASEMGKTSRIIE